MSNLFDSIQRAAFGIVTDTFGYDASWQPSDGADYQTGRVLFKEPTKQHELADIEYNPYIYIAEFFSKDFTGLYDAVASGRQETFTINGVDYWVRRVTSIWDGQTLRAILQKKI